MAFISKRSTALRWSAIIAASGAGLLLAAFFLFVGYHKSFDRVSELASHGAWTVWLPTALGKAVGWSEMLLACALLLGAFGVAPRIARVAAFLLIINQIVAGDFHAAHGELGALPQNALLVGLLAIVAARPSRRTISAPETPTA